jgi:hypothetical protein
MTRVSVTQGDLTNEATIQDSYDITLAFSVFPYVLPVLAKLAKATGEALVLETHNITSDLWKIYIEPLTMYFLHYTFVDYTDLGDSDGKRAVFIFSKERRTLSPGGFIASTIDLRRSDFQFIGSMMQFTSEVLGDCPRDRGALERLVHEAASLPDDTRCLTAGRTYWLQMMKGYLEYARQGEVRIDNTYVTFLRSVLETLKYDVVLADRLSSNHALLERVRLRFSDIDILAESDRSLAPIDPVHLSSLSDGAGRFPVIHGETGKTIWANGLDGYHRIFWASFFGVEKVPALFLL